MENSVLKQMINFGKWLQHRKKVYILNYFKDQFLYKEKAY